MADRQKDLSARAKSNSWSLRGLKRAMDRLVYCPTGFYSEI
jgi:hypothetical protein